MAEWARIVNAATNEFIRKEEVNVLRNRIITAMLKEKGRISFNHAGKEMDWKVRYRQGSMTPYGDNQPITFTRQNRHKTATLDWRGYTMAESITEREKQTCKNTEAIIKIFSTLGETMMQDCKEQFGTEFYVDGNAAGNESKIHGIESFMGNNGVSTAVPIGVNDDSFAGHDTDLAALGGSWTGNWPDGTGDAEYDAWSPLLVDYTSGIATGSGNIGWAASTKTWPNTCQEALRYCILYTQKNRTLEGALDLFMLDALLYRQLLDNVDANERILVERSGKDSKLVKLGFGNVINQDGVDVTWEYGIPASTGYGWNFDQMELRCLTDKLFTAEGPIFDENTLSYRFLIYMMGNVTWNPRYFAKLKNYT